MIIYCSYNIKADLDFIDMIKKDVGGRFIEEIFESHEQQNQIHHWRILPDLSTQYQIDNYLYFRLKNNVSLRVYFQEINQDKINITKITYIGKDDQEKEVNLGFDIRLFSVTFLPLGTEIDKNKFFACKAYIEKDLDKNGEVVYTLKIEM